MGGLGLNCFNKASLTLSIVQSFEALGITKFFGVAANPVS